MTYRGHVKNNVIVLEQGASLPEGTQVSIRPVKTGRKRKTLGQDLMKFAGVVKGMPSDMARNHDHYLHGAPRK